MSSKNGSATKIFAVLVALSILSVSLLMVMNQTPMNDLGTYSIHYEMNGGVNSSENPDEYKAGEKVELCDPFKADNVFKGWYPEPIAIEEDRVFYIDPMMRGDIVLYAHWSTNLVGTSMDYDLSGTMMNKKGASDTTFYDIDGTYELSHLSYDSVKGYQMEYIQEYTIVPSGGGAPAPYTTTEVYWTSEVISEGIWVYKGEETIKLYDGTEVLCDKVQKAVVKHNYMEVQTQWIVDDWLACKITVESEETVYDPNDGPTVSTIELNYELTKVDNVSDIEYTVKAFGDHGISVKGSGTYDSFSSVTLVAEVEDGTEFVGWYNEFGHFIGGSTTCTIVALSSDMRVFALNADDRDVDITGTGTVLEMGYGMTSSSWELIDYHTHRTVTTSTGSDFTYDFKSTAGSFILTCWGILDGKECGKFVNVYRDGPVLRTYEWKDNNDNSHNYSLEIQYSDFLSYREKDVIRHMSSDQEDLKFVTYNDKYIKKIASDFEVRYKDMSDDEVLDVILTFTQYIPYQLDSVYMGQMEYWKYPVETLFDNGGDCEDTVFLFCAIATAMGYETALLYFDGHMAAGIAEHGSGKTFTEDNDHFYYFGETTATGWKIGDIPSGLSECRDIIRVLSDTSSVLYTAGTYYQVMSSRV